jgi:drug/metabolite transporter (DMT)-like permease
VLFAFLTTVLFSISAVSANRSIRHFGATRANFMRLALATACLAALAHTRGQGLAGPAFWWFFVSGCIGFGLGDIALYVALPRIGARLTVLLTQCLAAPIAAAAEWGWLGTRVSLAQAACGVAILLGVALALAPGRVDATRRSLLVVGLVAGVVSAFGQGLGAVVSRKAYDVSTAHGVQIDGMTAAYQRILGGLLVTGLTLLPLRTRTPAANPATPLRAEVAASPATEAPAHPRLTRGIPWMVSNALAGPVLGVSCFQWALSTTPSAVVLPIVALTPIVVIPLAWLLEGDRPGKRATLGALVAVAGAAILAIVR